MSKYEMWEFAWSIIQTDPLAKLFFLIMLTGLCISFISFFVRRRIQHRVFMIGFSMSFIIGMIFAIYVTLFKGV